MSLLNSTYRSIKVQEQVLPTSRINWSSLWRCSRTLTQTEWLFSFPSTQKQLCFYGTYTVSVSKKQEIWLERLFICLQPSGWNLQGISNFPYSLFYHHVPLSDHLSAKNLRACWTESYHSVSKTAEIYDKEMKKKQLWTFLLCIQLSCLYPTHLKQVPSEHTPWISRAHQRINPQHLTWNCFSL